jgi:hypothetical protein
MSNLDGNAINNLKNAIQLNSLLKKFSSESNGIKDDKNNYILKPGKDLIGSFYIDAKKNIESQNPTGSQNPTDIDNIVGIKIIQFLEIRKKECYENKEKWSNYFYASVSFSILSVGLMIAGLLVAIISKNNTYWAMFGGGFILTLIAGYLTYMSNTTLNYYTEVYNNYYNTEINMDT